MYTVLKEPLKEYRIAIGWRIFLFIAIPPLTLLFLGLAFVLPFQSGNWQFALFFSPLGLGMTALCGYGFVDLIKGRLLKYDDRFVLIDPFGTKEMLFSNIKGFRVSKNYLLVYAKEGKPKQLKITSYLGKYDELLRWTQEYFVNLDEVDTLEAEKQILADVSFGRNTHEREEKLQQARNVAKALNWAGIGTGLWLILFPIYYEFAVAVGLLFPFPVIVAVYFFKGLIRINDGRGNAYPSIAMALLMPAFGLALRALMDMHLLSITPLVVPAALLVFIPMLLILLGSGELKVRQGKDLLAPVLGILLFAAYGFGGATLVNCLYDETTATIYEAEVLDKRISNGKTTTYYLELSSWGPQTEAEEVSVEEELYEYLEAGDSVNIYLKPGLLKAPWFFVTEKY